MYSPSQSVYFPWAPITRLPFSQTGWIRKAGKPSQALIGATSEIRKVGPWEDFPVSRPCVTLRKKEGAEGQETSWLGKKIFRTLNGQWFQQELRGSKAGCGGARWQPQRLGSGARGEDGRYQLLGRWGARGSRWEMQQASGEWNQPSGRFCRQWHFRIEFRCSFAGTRDP